MPLTGISSYGPTMEQFIAHWSLVNEQWLTSRGDDFIVNGTYALPDLQSDRAALLSAIDFATTQTTARDQAALIIEPYRTLLRDRLFLLRRAANYLLPNAPTTNALPLVPNATANAADFRAVNTAMTATWTQLNALPAQGAYNPPLVLSDGTTLAQFQASMAGFPGALDALIDAEVNATTARNARDALMPPIKAHLVDYRKAVLALLAPNDPLVASLPAVSPGRGHTPDPVTLSGVWNPATQQTDLSWSASTDADLERYAVRFSPGPRYKAPDEQAIGDVLPGTTTFSTAAGLSSAGSVGCFKVFVVLTMGNERGSNSVKIVRG